MFSHSLFSLAFFLRFAAFAFAYNFTFTSTPQQCQNLSLSISGTGVPPYNILLIPSGPSPLPNNVEARKIVEYSSQGYTQGITFQLAYPAYSQFVAVVSDSSAFGSGGTSATVTVQSSPDASCFDSTTSVSPDFTFSIDPPNQIVQCSPTRIWWDPSTVQGTPKFLGVIPGGQSFSIPSGTISNVANKGTGFSWTPSVRGGTTLVLIGGDSRGDGTGGSSSFTVSQGDNSCLSGTSPSSTPGSPAGGNYPTGINSPSGNSGQNPSSPSNNTAAIAGGVVGGIVLLLALLLVGLFFWRRSKMSKAQKERPVDLLQGDEEGDDSGRVQHLPQYYHPEPFLATEPTTSDRRSSSINDELLGLGSLVSDGRPQSRTSLTLSATTHDAPGGSAVPSSRKSAAGLRPMRLVNIIQHDDAGPSDNAPKDGEAPETIELPPAYNLLKK